MAHLTRVAVWNDPSCSITYFDTRDMVKYGYAVEDEFIAWYTNRLKQGTMSGFDYTLVESINIPSDRSQRGEWSLIDGKVKVDPVKVAQKEAKRAEVEAVLGKLKISSVEFDKLKGRV